MTEEDTLRWGGSLSTEVSNKYTRSRVQQGLGPRPSTMSNTKYDEDTGDKDGSSLETSQMTSVSLQSKIVYRCRCLEKEEGETVMGHVEKSFRQRGESFRSTWSI